MRIFGLQKTTLLDYPGKLASVVFTGGCNMNCPYCHNSELIRGPFGDLVSEEEVFAHLKKRQSTLEGLVITGGECTLQPDLLDFCKKVRSFGYDIKLDTNGTSPDTLSTLVEEGLIQYVAMDIKNSKGKYSATVGVSNFDLSGIEKSVDYLLENHVDYEFRTTVVDEFHEERDIEEIGKWIAGAKAYYLQAFRQGENVFDKSLHTPSDEKMLKFKEIASKYISNTEIRGLDL